ncbi:MAG TPA: hypothetical protein DIV86_06570 [Alphaproteobacteria bacterium]|nr:hypothetical protein [Alphaproteobacteria bacterium]
MTYKELLNNFHSAIVDIKLEAAENVISQPQKGTKKERIKIYTEGYFIRITDALADIYSAFTAHIGFDKAQRIFTEFLKKHPSTGYNLDTYCVSFYDYFSQISGSKILTELVRLESEILKNHFREDSPAISPQKLAETSPEDFAKLVLKQRNESVLLEFDHDVETYFQEYETNPRMAIEKKYCSVFICRRPDYQQKRHSLTRAETEFLKLLFAGNNVDEAITRFSALFAEYNQEIEANFQNWFSKWVQNGFFK